MAFGDAQDVVERLGRLGRDRLASDQGGKDFAERVAEAVASGPSWSSGGAGDTSPADFSHTPRNASMEAVKTAYESLAVLIERFATSAGLDATELD